MKLISKSIFLSGILLAGLAVTSCENETDYDDTNTNNPSFVQNYNDSTVVSHPESLAGTTYQRTAGIKTNAYGQDVEGYVESLTFDADSVVVKMSEPSTIAALGDGTDAYMWTDDSNTSSLPYYEYTYSATTGRIEIIKNVKSSSGAVSKSTIFMGVAVSGTINNRAADIITISHFGDIPVQTYLVRQ